MAAAGFAFSTAIYRHSRLSHRESEAARVRTAQINGCRICQAWRGAADTPALLAAAGAGDGPSVVDNGPVPDEAFYQAITDWRGSPLFSPRERAAIAFFGIRGIGSLYYLAYAVEHARFPGVEQLWALVAFTVVVSIVVHGTSATLVTRRLDARREHERASVELPA